MVGFDAGSGFSASSGPELAARREQHRDFGLISHTRRNAHRLVVELLSFVQSIHFAERKRRAALRGEHR